MKRQWNVNENTTKRQWIVNKKWMKSIKSMATNLGSNKYQPDELLHRLLKKIDEFVMLKNITKYEEDWVVWKKKLNIPLSFESYFQTNKILKKGKIEKEIVELNMSHI